MFDTNRRKFPRANYPCHLTLWRADGEHETILANTSNIGIGGLCVHLVQNIEEGTKVDIQIQFTDTTTPFKCRGVVVRSETQMDRSYTLGIKFEPLSELKASFLDGKISEIVNFKPKGKS